MELASVNHKHTTSVLAACLMRHPLSEALTSELEYLNTLSWTAHVNQRDYQGDWDVLPLRCLDIHGDSHPILQGFAHEGGADWRDLPVLHRAPALHALINTIHAPLKSARLMRLAPGAEIKRHRDAGLAWEYGEARLHLSLRTDPRVIFMVGGQRVLMGQGELWYLNADVEHSVVNSGVEDRIHLVVDCAVNEWLQTAILAAPPLS